MTPLVCVSKRFSCNYLSKEQKSDLIGKCRLSRSTTSRIWLGFHFLHLHGVGLIAMLPFDVLKKEAICIDLKSWD